jgi:hypothetical protein
VKLPGQRLIARDFDRQVVEAEIRMAVMIGYTASAIPVTEAISCIRQGKGGIRRSDTLCYRASLRHQIKFHSKLSIEPPCNHLILALTINESGAYTGSIVVPMSASSKACPCVIYCERPSSRTLKNNCRHRPVSESELK